MRAGGHGRWGSRAGGLNSAEMARLRKAEVTDAIWLLAPSAQVMQLSLPEGRWSEDELRAAFEQVLHSFDPTIIYAPSCVDYHPEHIQVAEALAHTLSMRKQSSRQAIRVYEVQVPLTPVLANTISDISAVCMLKRMALFQYRTQAESLGTEAGKLGWPERHALYLRLLYRARGNVEVFWEMTAEQYIKIMSRRSKQAKFRGLRPRPFTDGLAWVVGWRERVRLGELSNK